MYLFAAIASSLVANGEATEAPNKWVRDISKYNDCQNAATTDDQYLAIEEDCPFGGPAAIPVGLEEIEVWFARHAESSFNEAMRDPTKLVARYTGDIFTGAVKSGVDMLSKSGADFLSMSASTETMTTTIRDAPLSLVGIEQAMRLREYLYACTSADCPFANLEKTAFATSNLRRAALTLLIVLSHRERPIISQIRHLVDGKAAHEEGKAEALNLSAISLGPAVGGGAGHEDGEAEGVKSAEMRIGAAATGGGLGEGEAVGLIGAATVGGGTHHEGQSEGGYSYKISILSSLQEFKGNVAAIDTNSLAARGQRPILNPFVTPAGSVGTAGGPPVENHCKFKVATLTSVLDPRCNKGDQFPVAPSDRLNEFCDWVRFKAAVERKEKIFVTGHSHWLIKFYEHFGPQPEGDVEETAAPKRAGGAGLGGALSSGGGAILKAMKGMKQHAPKASSAARDGWNPLETSLAIQHEKIANAALIRFKLKFTAMGGCEIIPGSSTLVYPGEESSSP